ncbi:MAG: efflux RND transporter periplasmic adaptor subunit [Gemmatimonadetes bacterium]|nr:efflux RND transporter periplasmic adaptor subunit [Gemmatimonadota bacterium]
MLAIVAVLLVTRRAPSAPAAAAAGHEHTGGAPAASAAAPVMLSADASRRIGVTYTLATIGPLAREVRTVGQVTVDETRVKSISPKIDGWVERLDLNYLGMPVRAGDPLLAIYSPMLVTVQEELLLAKKLAMDVVGGTSEATRSAAELLSSARRRLAYWDIPQSDIDRIEQTGEVLRTLTLRSPVSGVVVEKSVFAGQKIMAGDAIFRIADLSIVWVEGEVFEQDLSLVRMGRTVTAEFEALPGEQVTGRIAYLYPTLNPDTRTARVRVEMRNPGLRLKPGMYATFRFSAGNRLNVLSVPRSAILSTGARSLVFVKRADGQLEPRDVTLGVAGVDRVEVRSGLEAGETVVASATFLVDAESNLGSALGGMGNMPGMDMSPAGAGAKAPARPPGTPSQKDTGTTAPDAMAEMPGMKPPPPARRR